MYWPDTGTGVDTEPARKPVASAVRKYFTEGGAGEPPTVPGGDWFNAITNEVLNVLAAAGIDPSKTDDDQLLLAIQRISKAMSAREALRRTYAEAGFNLVPGSFELGGTVTTATDVLLYEADGHAYNWDGVFPGGGKVVPQGSTPASTGGVGPGLWLDQATATLRSQLSSETGADMVGACPSVSALRSIEPTRNGQRIDVNSYYDDWAVLAGGEPKYGGRFWYDPNDSTTADDGFKVIVTTGGKRWKRIKSVYSIGHAGAREDEDFDSTAYVQAAVNGTKAGEELLFTGGPFKFNKAVLTKSVILSGDARLIHNGFIIKASNVTSNLVGIQQCWQYQTSSRGFQCWAYMDGVDYSTIHINGNHFRGFFYATDFRGCEYEAAPDDPSNRVLKGVNTAGCTSIAPAGVPAGHFQHTGVTNAKCSLCSTYGGINATSYNFINGNGYIIVDSCYDENNTYGSLEIENNRVSFAVVSGNVFGETLWIDDTANVAITGNTVAGRIFITSQSNDTDNITISGNVCSRISITKFGTGPLGRHKSVQVVGNTTYGETGSNDLFADDSVEVLTAESNCFNGATDSAIAVVRSVGCNHLLRNNKSRVIRPLTISGSGGSVVEYGNLQMTNSGLSDSKHLSNLMKPSNDYIDLPGKYLHGTKYTGNIAPGGTVGLALPIPDSGSLAFRGVSLWVMIRDSGSNNISSYRVDGLYRVVGASIALSFAPAYSTQGVDFASITLANNGSTSSSINILVTNTSGAKTLQVTVMPEVSSRLGTEE